jgi:membrane protease YdiL (CAAX protease family)
MDVCRTATLAGAGYAAVFWRTASLEMCILTHFVVNAVHFLCFTYPSLTQGDSLMFMFVSMFLLLLTFAR